MHVSDLILFRTPRTISLCGEFCGEHDYPSLWGVLLAFVGNLGVLNFCGEDLGVVSVLWAFVGNLGVLSFVGSFMGSYGENLGVISFCGEDLGMISFVGKIWECLAFVGGFGSAQFCGENMGVFNFVSPFVERIWE